MIGSTVGHYRVTARLSEGGMGIVYRAEHSLLGKPAAIKVLHPELSTNRDIVQRFFNEAKATTSIRHVGIVEVFDFGYLESGHAYLVMELLEGEPLSAAIRRGRLGQTAALLLLRGVCSALIAAHAKGIVHRDLKPDNIFLIPDADSPIGVRPKLLDFGIAKLTDLTSSVSATRTGAVMGTPTYMSPEQCAGNREVDARADLYSLGCVLYELLCGRPPFSSQGAGELIGLHQYVAPESPRSYAPEISPQLERLVLSLLAKSPADRPQSAAELVQRIDELARAGHLSGVAYELATNPGASFPRLGSHPGSLAHTPAPLTPAPLRAPDAPTVATPYGLQVPSSPSLAPTTLGAAAGVTSAGGPARSRGKVVAAVVAGLGLAIAATVLLVREGGGAVAPGAPPAAGEPAGQPPLVSPGAGERGEAAGAASGSAGSASVEATGSGSASVEATGSGSAPVEATGSGSASVEAAGSGSASVEAMGRGSASVEATGSGAAGQPPPVRRKGKPRTKPKANTAGDVPILIEDDI